MISLWLVCTFLALVGKGRRAAHDEPRQARQSLVLLLTASKRRQLTLLELGAARRLAQRAQLPQVAQVLLTKIYRRRDVVMVGAVLTPPAGGAMACPLPGLEYEAWRAYVARSRIGQQHTVSPTYQLGWFQLGARALQDVGVMDAVTKTDRVGKSVWVGVWRAPHTEATWLASPLAQYQALALLTAQHYAELRQVPEVVGTVVDGTTTTVSGLLGVMRCAGGLRGLSNWLKRPGDRHKFQHTTQTFQRLNGIF